MTETKRCPHCGASNRLSAEWCNLCLERFDAEVPAAPEPAVAPSMADPSEPEEVARLAAEDPRPSATAVVSPASTKEGSATGSSAFVVTEEGIRWKCPTCDHINLLDLRYCEICGASFADAVKPVVERPPRDAGTAALISLFLPGAGHAYLGLWPQAVTRAVVSTWVVLVVVAGALQRDIPGSFLLAVTFGLVAFALWVTAAHDAYREARGETAQVILKGRVFLYVVLGLLSLLFVMLVAAGFSARG
ncbi:MAG: hypothetical protein M3238_02110 [Actinomycetota bacterium]|nr:hypothetical protein [Actinomycetota bacterium]